MIALMFGVIAGAAAGLIGFGMVVRAHRRAGIDEAFGDIRFAAEPRRQALQSAAAAALARRGWGRRLANDLPHAGVRAGAGAFVMRCAGIVAAFGFGAAVVAGPRAGIVAAGATAMTIRAVVRRRARRWLTRFEDELPTALDLCAGSLEAGASLAQAIELVAAEERPPLSDELGRALAENRLGEPIAVALEHAAARVGSREFTWVVRAVHAQQEYGASMASLLRTASETMRARAEIRGEVRALTAEGRISAAVLIALPFAVAGFFSIANPGYLSVLTATPGGWALLGIATVLMSGGAAWMRRIIRVEV